MSDTLSLEAILGNAKDREKQYDWLGATEYFKKALALVSDHDYPKKSEICERLGYAYFRASMKAESATVFKTSCTKAIESYEEAKRFYGGLNELQGKLHLQARMLRTEAAIALTGYWLAEEVSEKRRMLDECWRLAKECLGIFEKTGDALEYGITCNRFLLALYHRFFLEWDFKAREKIVKEAMEYGERATTLLSGVSDPCELNRIYVKTATFVTTFGICFISDMDEKERYYQKGLDYWQKAIALSEETALLELLEGGWIAWSVDEILAQMEKALKYAMKTEDKYLIGNALDRLAYAGFWKSLGTEDMDKRREIIQRVLQCAEDAGHNFSSISFTSPRAYAFWTGAPHAEYYMTLSGWEIDLAKRRDLLEKAVTYGIDGVKLAESTDYPDSVLTAHHVLGKVLGSLAKIESSFDEKKRLLQRALEHRNKALEISEQLDRFAYWDLGVNWGYLADLKAELGNIEKNPENAKKMLEEAVSDKERCVLLCTKEILYWEKRGDLSYFSAFGGYEYSYGDLLNRLYTLTNNTEYQKKAVKAFEEAAESFRKQELTSRMADCYWKVAHVHDTLGEYLKAAENFRLASKNCTSAAEKTPQLRDFFQSYALYTEAWAEIEKARHHHRRQEYDIAKGHFEKAASIHSSLKQWRYLTPNYAAWVKVEEAEDLSRKEQNEEALKAFGQAAELFDETKKSIRAELGKIEDSDEKKMAADILGAAHTRREYCNARLAVEEARTLDKKGDHCASAEKYGSAIETFEKIARLSQSEQDKKEVKYIISLSRAWQKMAQAEAEASPELYMEASQLFEETKDFAPNESMKMLVLGNSRFCRALEAGAKFADTRDTTLHSAAMQHLESAANYYVKAGFQNASDYAKATGLLFDAYLYMGNAKKEDNPEKRSKLYMMAEKVLRTSAGSYTKAKYPAKMEQVIRLLESVKEDQELAMSLTEMLHAPVIASTTAFSAPTPTSEKASGIERFENAGIQANITTNQRELRVGENLELEIELINAGKGPALLIKITEWIPDGFELAEKPETYRLEGGDLSMKGKPLNPLKTEEIRLVLRSKAQGTFKLKPRIFYLDENGEYKTHEPEPISITVKELGIKGWLKGEG